MYPPGHPYHDPYAWAAATGYAPAYPMQQYYNPYQPAQYAVGGAPEIAGDIVGQDVDAILGQQRGMVPFRGGTQRPMPYHPAQFHPQAYHPAMQMHPQAYHPAMAGPPPAPAPFNVQGTHVQEREPSRARRQPLPIDSVAAIAVATQATITARPQSWAYRPERWVIGQSIAPFFTIDDMKIGNVSQFVSQGSLSAETFTQTAFDCNVRNDTVQGAYDVVFVVSNIDPLAAHRFLATVFGETVLK